MTRAKNFLDRVGVIAGALAGAGVTTLIVIGSEGLRHFDLALLPYAMASVFAVAAVVYR